MHALPALGLWHRSIFMPTCQGRYAPPEAVALLPPPARTILKYALFYHENREFTENSEHSLQRLILATSLDPDKHNLLELYSRRWQIELLFKRSKSIFHFRRLRHSSLGYTLSLSRAWSAVIRLASFAASFFQIPFFDFFSLFASCFA